MSPLSLSNENFLSDCVNNGVYRFYIEIKERGHQLVSKIVMKVLKDESINWTVFVD